MLLNRLPYLLSLELEEDCLITRDWFKVKSLHSVKDRRVEVPLTHTSSCLSSLLVSALGQQQWNGRPSFLASFVLCPSKDVLGSLSSVVSAACVALSAACFALWTVGCR